MGASNFLPAIKEASDTHQGLSLVAVTSSCGIGLPNHVVIVFSSLIGLLGRPIIQFWTASGEMTKSIAPRFAHIARGRKKFFPETLKPLYFHEGL